MADDKTTKAPRAATRGVQAFELHRPIGELAKYGLGVHFGPPPAQQGWTAEMNEDTGVLVLRVKSNGKTVWTGRFPHTSIYWYRLTTATVRSESDD